MNNPSEKMILIVDDDDFLVTWMTVAMQEEGYRILTENSPQNALALAAGDEPDLIISDIMMKPFDGFTFKRNYEENYPFRQTPFLFVSGKTEPEDIIEGLSQGAVDYLTKPLHKGIFLAKVKNILKQYERFSFVQYQGSFVEGQDIAKVIEFFQEKGVTGILILQSDGVSKSFELLEGRPANPETAMQLATAQGRMSSGRFWLVIDRAAQARDEDLVFDLDSAAVDDAQLASRGLLSFVRAGNKVVELQTEFLQQPTPRCLTSVFFKGRLLYKKETDLPPNVTSDIVSQEAEKLHKEVEAEIRQRLTEMQTKSAEEALEPKSDSEPEPPTVLLVAEKPLDLDLLMEKLQRAGCDVKAARTPENSIAQLRENNCKLILCDCSARWGTAFCEYIRTSQFHALPFVALFPNPTEAERDLAKQADANACWSKNLGSEEFASRIDDLLAQHQAAS